MADVGLSFAVCARLPCFCCSCIWKPPVHATFEQTNGKYGGDKFSIYGATAKWGDEKRKWNVERSFQRNIDETCLIEDLLIAVATLFLRMKVEHQRHINGLNYTECICKRKQSSRIRKLYLCEYGEIPYQMKHCCERSYLLKTYLFQFLMKYNNGSLHYRGIHTLVITNNRILSKWAIANLFKNIKR